MQPSLFEEPSSFDRRGLAEKLRRLKEENIYIGGSSWKYEGWLGQIYTAERYFHHGKFSQKRFQEQCLTEYAETFPVVCGDFSFYQFPSPEFWQNLFRTAPLPLQFAFKVPEEITCKFFPNHPRYGTRAGQPNPSFLDSDLLESIFLQPLAPYRERVSVFILEFGTFSSFIYPNVQRFCQDLDQFLAALPTGWRYAVEIRNPEFFVSEYFDILRRHGIAHVFNSWNRMPSLRDQIAAPEAHTADFTVVRALLRTGRSYEQAVALFSPYTKMVEENSDAREAMRSLIERSRKRQEAMYLFVNNRLEGNAPITIQSVTD